MNKHLITLGIAILLLVVGLSGCEKTVEITGDTDQVEIINYSVTTEWHIPKSGTDRKFIVGETAKILSHGYLDKIIIYILSQNQKYSKSGFYKDYPEEACNQRYIIHGTVKNIAGKILNYVTIDAKFYDINGVYLSSKSNSISNLANTHICDFEINYCGHERYFENAYYMELVISAS